MFLFYLRFILRSIRFSDKIYPQAQFFSIFKPKSKFSKEKGLFAEVKQKGFLFKSIGFGNQ